MNGRTAKLLRRTALLAGLLFGPTVPAAHLPNIKRTWHATPRPQRQATRATLQHSVAKGKALRLGEPT